MKKTAVSLVVACLFGFTLFGVASAMQGVSMSRSVFMPAQAAFAEPVSPVVIAVNPTAAPNDIHTPITITVAGLTHLGAPPAINLVRGSVSVPLTGVIWSGDTTLAATAPWGLDAGTYELTVANPDGSSATLFGAYTVEAGIGQWNAGDLFGGVMTQLLMKPGDPNTLYALSADVGLFRTTDGAESWRLIDCNVIANSDFVLDPSHPDRLYTYRYDAPEGLCVSNNSGDSFIWMPHQAWTSVDSGRREVFVSPSNPNLLFECSYQENSGRVGQGIVNGLKKSTDAGNSWSAVISVAGRTNLPVQSVAFDPSDSSRMVLATSDGGVYRSTNGGVAWSQAAAPPMRAPDLGMGGFVTYNPWKPGEVWFGSPQGGLFRSEDAALTSWKDVSVWGAGVYTLSFPADNIVYTPRAYSTLNGDSWNSYGPTPWYGARGLVFSPGTTQTAYIADDDVGIRKTTTGGADGWPAKNQGLTGLRLSSMDVSRANPLRVYAAFTGPLGMFLSEDGTNHWTFCPVPDMWNVRQVLEDPFDSRHLYGASDPGLFESTSTGATWTNLGWNLPAGAPANSLTPIALDPHTPGHLVGAMFTGAWNAGHSVLYDSTDGGKTWRGPNTSLPARFYRVTSIKFDSETAGTVYLTTAGTGLYRSRNNGATWARLDHPGALPKMTTLQGIAIATHPQHVLLVNAAEDPACRSFDNGQTWQAVTNVFAGTAAPGECMFANNDSTRLYTATGWGLCFSGDVGRTWTPAAGSLGHLAITGLNWGVSDGHVLVYAATKGGNPGTTSGVAGNVVARAGQRTFAATTRPNLVDAGIYRRAQVSATKTFTSWALRDGWVLESREKSSVGGSANSGSTTMRVGDNAARKQYRSILSFATSGLPDSAVITKVTLRVKKQGVAGGGNPVTKFGGFRADVKRGYFGTRTTLQTSDFQARPDKTVGPYKPALVRGWYSINLTSARAQINKTTARSGCTQIRLRFSLDDNNNRIANYLRIYSGNASAANRPQLVVTYYVP